MTSAATKLANLDPSTSSDRDSVESKKKQDLIGKLERFTARLRAASSLSAWDNIFSVTDLTRMLNKALVSKTTPVAILPVRQKVAPNRNTWNETQVVMPACKTRKKRVGDPSYGAGVASERKVKKGRITANKSDLGPP